MKLLTKAIKAKLPPISAGIAPGPSMFGKGGLHDAKFTCKFFDPKGSWTWYVLEGWELPDGDWLFYGLVDGFEKAWGYFRLSDLERVRTNVPFHTGIERDLYFSDVPVESVWPAST